MQLSDFIPTRWRRKHAVIKYGTKSRHCHLMYNRQLYDHITDLESSVFFKQQVELKHHGYTCCDLKSIPLWFSGNISPTTDNLE